MLFSKSFNGVIGGHNPFICIDPNDALDTNYIQDRTKK